MEKKHTPFYIKFFNFMKSKAFRRTFFIVLYVLFALSLLLIDKSNAFRNRFFPFLNDNKVVNFLGKFNIKYFDVNKSTWIIFFMIFSVTAVLLFGSIFADRFVKSLMKKVKTENDEEYKKAFSKRKLVYYLCLLCFSLLLIGIFAILGGFRHLSAIDGKAIQNILHTFLIFVATVILIPIAVLIFYFFVKFCALLTGWFVENVIHFTKASNTLRNSDGVLEDDRIKLKNEAENDFEKPRYIDTNGLSGIAGNVQGANEHDSETKKRPVDPENLFPTLTKIDRKYADGRETVRSDNVTLEQFVLQFQSFAINKHQIYYGLPLLRAFISGLSVSRLMILEGLSGTGKSMLPRMFCEFTNSNSLFAPVQATWRDKSDLLGFYSEFTKNFKTTDFLTKLYESSYSDKINMMVLDEMNISRIEYYFADFLSILEYPSEDWKVRVYEPELNQNLPAKLTDGYIKVPTNTWFIGTANTDDSTFTITDKVYDRAIKLDFKEKISPITSEYDSAPINISADALIKLFEEAQADEEKRLNKEETEKFLKICDFMRDSFDVRFGNRIMVQINGFVPVYVALGGTKESALDYIFATKIMRKLDGVYEDYIKDELARLVALLNNTYGKGTFRETERIIAKISKRLV